MDLQKKIWSKLVVCLTRKNNWSGQDFDKNFLDSKHVLKVYFKLSRKNPDFGFLPLPSEPVWLKTPYLSAKLSIESQLSTKQRSVNKLDYVLRQLPESLWVKDFKLEQLFQPIKNSRPTEIT